ncbi:hypothetical protein TcasGA2_TC033897 [Tribolium castaneum]|uniref:Uncharacterized protein n=1 Tax=Tribolium castaneum TaxID=7070 RepID=A0A139WE17_TRICA|nr:hypothetical protein TcasGA2_TC033897 [Tribolium castaneum]
MKRNGKKKDEETIVEDENKIMKEVKRKGAQQWSGLCLN